MGDTFRTRQLDDTDRTLGDGIEGTSLVLSDLPPFLCHPTARTGPWSEKLLDAETCDMYSLHISGAVDVRQGLRNPVAEGRRRAGADGRDWHYPDKSRCLRGIMKTAYWL